MSHMLKQSTIMITSPCKVYPLTPHFYEAVLTCSHDHCFEQKSHNFSSENYHFNNCEILQYIARTCLRNALWNRSCIWFSPVSQYRKVPKFLDARNLCCNLPVKFKQANR